MAVEAGGGDMTSSDGGGWDVDVFLRLISERLNIDEGVTRRRAGSGLVL